MITFEIVDVFTDRAYAGNQLAVVYGAEDLAPAQMQAIAAEFGYSETSFILPGTTAGADYRARIFTPAEELPFAGHPTIGSALSAARTGFATPNGGKVVQECGSGLMTIELDGDTAKLTSTAISVGDKIDAAFAATSFGYAAAQVIGTPQATSAGLPHNFVRLSDADVTAAKSTPGGLDFVYLFSFDEATNAVHGRLFASGVGVAEDPATGSAAVALGVYLVEQGLITGDGIHTYEISQGAEIDRPSKLYGEVVVDGGKAVEVSVTGSAILVAKGELVTLP
ncbi:PhzF family phenazine biosynthesis protein [Glycomyces buryatensis]|uniref:PhzF family phenazine biosynthesis protein n=1 Tax=Glycomyces buryatensis TaxID=2570927 RepID=A0A4V4HSD0_9ACTN|nr:PhzF family phenazine biosynthesis protein [Glycomyces buryatensis]THV41086.1 PhzF family phenazine biosynthesis protein [Glycomyces buryatensis]